METVQIVLTVATLDRMQRYSKRPLLETPEIVLNRILDIVEQFHPHSANGPNQEAHTSPSEYRTSRGVHLPVGLELWASYRGTNPTAQVTAEGFKYGGKTYDDPSAAAKAAKLDAGASETASSTNGWVFWMVKASQSPTGKVDSIDVFRRAY